MLIEEARWFGEKISAIPSSNIFPLLNIGSSTKKFRHEDQPWIEEYIFKPIRDNNQKVFHLDIKEDPGVDIVGDISDVSFLRKLSDKSFKSVFCSNLLEHVHNKKDISKALTSVIPIEGYIFVSCPYRYGYHPDPIDTMFRPNIEELHSMFQDTEIIYGEIVTGHTYYFYNFLESSVLIRTVVRSFMPFYKPKEWNNILKSLFYLIKSFQATCLVLQKRC